MALFGPFLAILSASRMILASMASNLLILWVLQSSDLDLILAYAPLICLLSLLSCKLTDAWKLLSVKPSPKARKRKEKVQLTTRPKRRAIKRLGFYVEWAIIPLLSMMLSMELGNAMSIGHWQMRRENDSALDIYGSAHGMASMDGAHNNREKRSAVSIIFNSMENVYCICH